MRNITKIIIGTLLLLTCANSQFKYDALINTVTSKELINLKPENAEKYFNTTLMVNSIKTGDKLSSIKFKYEGNIKDKKSVFDNLDLEFLTDGKNGSFNYLRISIDNIELKDMKIIINKIDNVLSDSQVDTTYTSDDKMKFDLNCEWELTKPYRVYVTFTSEKKAIVIVENAGQYYIEDPEYDG